jgi:uncharacterized metal-binding protein YceD (DUF177 family)
MSSAQIAKMLIKNPLANGLPSTDSYAITITRDDPWLARIASDLAPSSPEATDITGQLNLRADQAGFVYVTGSVCATALLPCDRCGQLVTTHLTPAMNATFRPPYAGAPPREMLLDSGDMDVYFLENDCVDIEQLVHDALQCALPGQIHCIEDAGCRPIEHACGSDDLADEDGPADWASSPFAILKDYRPS